MYISHVQECQPYDLYMFMKTPIVLLFHIQNTGYQKLKRHFINIIPKCLHEILNSITTLTKATSKALEAKKNG